MVAGIVVAGVAVVLLLLVLAAIRVRNRMIDARNRVDESWSGIDVQLTRRHDLVPNLVETVKGYAAHERELFDAVTQARSSAIKASGPREVSDAEGRLSAGIVDIRAVAENYPQLRASENFQTLQRELSEIEDEIQAARRIYNSNVQIYNTMVQVFPNSLVAGSSGLTPREFFEVADRVREPVGVSFS
jgi:LemA protein